MVGSFSVDRVVVRILQCGNGTVMHGVLVKYNESSYCIS